jgi:hypothetical protein
MKYTTAAATIIAKIVNDMFSMQNTPGGHRFAAATICPNEINLNCGVLQFKHIKILKC